MTRPIPNDRHVEALCDRLRDIGRQAEQRANRLKAHLALVRRGRSGQPDGYPASVRGGGIGGAELTSVEGAADRRIAGVHDELSSHVENELAYLEQAIASLDASTSRSQAVDRLLDDHDLNPRPQCWIITHVGKITEWDPRFDEHVRTDFDGVLARKWDQPRPVCRWAYDFVRAQRRLPTQAEIAMYADRGVVRVRDAVVTPR